MAKLKYSEARHKKICELISGGMPHKEAAQAVGIGERTFYDWKDKYPQFSADVQKADAEFINTHLANITKASLKNWQASAWLLERRHPDLFGRQRTELAGDIGITVTFEENNGKRKAKGKQKDKG